jgi:acetylornithine deacetylase/succinyl-diaminopimelate desuccinylase-like protein
MSGPKLLEELFGEIDRLKPVDLAAELVRLPSHPGLERQEEKVVLALAHFFDASGLTVQIEEVLPGRPNLLVSVEGRLPGRHLLLCGHTDTVPANEGDTGVGFSGEVHDGRLHGRGSVDMKGALAAMAATVVALDGRLPAGRVTFAAVIDEEMESLGTEKLVETSFRAEGAVVGEPTSNRIALGHKGLEWLEVHFEGRSAHGGTPEQGVNAVSAAGDFVSLVERELKPRLAARRHPVLGSPTINFGTIRGGDQPSTVAAHCMLALDRRTVPGESFQSVVAELTELLARVERNFPGLHSTVRRVPGGMGNLLHVALVTQPDSPLARAAVAARELVTGEAGPFSAFPAWTDGALLSGYAGIPTIVLGPGDLSLAHSPRESVPVSEIVDAAKIYAALAIAFTAAEAP